MSDGSVTIDANMNNKGVDDGIDSIENKFKKLKSTVTKVLGAIELGKLVKDGVEYNAKIEQLQTSFEVMTGSAEKAVETVNTLRKMGADTPYELSGLAETTQLLMQYGFDADNAVETTKMLGDISQGSAEKMMSIGTGFAQMSSAGKVNLQDIKQMINGGFNPLQEIAKTTGESMSSLYDRISKGKMTIDEITASIKRATSEGGQFYQSSEKQAQTLNGRWSTLKDNWGELLGKVLTPVSDFIRDTILPNVTELVNYLSAKIDTVEWEKFSNTLNTLVTVIIGATTAFLAYTAVIKISALIDLLTNSTTYLTIAQKALNLVMSLNPIGLVIAGITALIAVVIYLWNTNEGFRTAVINIFETIKQKAIQVFEWFQNLPYNMGVLIGTILGILIQLPGKIWNILVTAYNKFVDWFKNLKDIAIKKLPEIISTIFNKFNELPGKMLEVGGNIVRGLWNGIQNAKDWIIGKVGEFARGILDGMKNALGIHSPSVLFNKEVGRYIPPGIWNGVKDEMPKLYKNMENAVNFETDRLSSEISSAPKVENIDSGDTYNENHDVHVTNNFYSKTDSPYETSKKIKRTMEDLVYAT